MKKSKFELPEDRLATTDERGSRVYLYPADVRGYFKNIRKYVHFLLMIFFLVLPWIKISGTQSVLLDIPQRRFAFFGITFWAHDAPMLIFVILTVFFGIAFVTVVWGRLWCGWACPETVFIESVYRRIENWIEGDAVQRRTLDASPWSFFKVLKKTIKWILFLAVTLIISHSFLAYFVGTEKLMEMIQHDPRENPTSFMIMAFVTSILLFAFGWFREQFCIIMCPYGRLQSVLMDKSSFAVVYDDKRGEPRKGLVDSSKKEGDCINCYRCVQVCPTGVDIRRGVQLECIACTACIDACDEVMTKIKKPLGLIRYDTENNLNGIKSPKVRTRSVLYGGVAAVAFICMLVFISIRKPVDITILKAREMPYQKIAEDRISNHFKLVMSNKTFETQNLELELSQEDLEQEARMITVFKKIKLEPGQDLRSDFFIEFPKEKFLKLGQGRLKMILKGQNEKTNETWSETQELKILGPF